MEDNEFISKLISLDGRIELVLMRRSHWLSKDAINAADFALAFIHQFLGLSQDEQQAILASIERGKRRS